MLKEMYFVRATPDGQDRIFRCHLDLSKHKINVYISNIIHPYLIRDNSFLTYKEFSIHFGVECGALMMSHMEISVQGLLEIDGNFFKSGFCFYFQKSFIQGWKELEMGN